MNANAHQKNDNEMIGFSPRFEFNTERGTELLIVGDSDKFLFNTTLNIERQITALSGAFNYNTESNIARQIVGISAPFAYNALRNIDRQIMANSSVFQFDTQRHIALQIIGESDPFPFSTLRNIALQIMEESDPFAFNTLRNIEYQIISHSNPFLFDTRRNIAMQITNNSDLFIFNTLRNIAREIAAHSGEFLFDTRRDMALFLIGQSSSFNFKTTKDIAFQIIAFAEFIPIFNPLPIELLSFGATENQGSVYLEWVTLSETNNHYFTILRSANGISFSPVTNIQGAGNSNTTLSYSYNDLSPYTGINYYLLRQTDFDGTTSESHIIAVEVFNLGNGAFSVLYHSGHMHVSLPWESEKKADYFIFDIMGRPLKSGSFVHTPGKNNLIEVQDLPDGVLIFSLSGNNSLFNEKLFKY
jgi:hypothetical protein